MGLRGKINLAFFGIFAVGLIIAGFTSYLTELQHAREEVIEDANVMLRMALAARTYTVEQVRPAVKQGEDEFLPQTVPSYAAQELFLNFNKDFPEFTYREAALNPTNPRDIASSWEVDVIQQFIADENETSIVGTRDSNAGQMLYLARPIRITDESCLSCHTTPEVAPASMVALYGSNGGFGWKMNEVVGTQIVSVPMEIPYQAARQTTFTLVGSLFSIFTLVLIAVNLIINRAFLIPLKEIALVAERYSQGEIDIREFEGTRQDEIGMLERSTNRLRRSLEKAMNIVEGKK